MAWDFETEPEFQSKHDPVFPDYALLSRKALAMELYPDPVGEIADAAEAVA